MARCYRPGAVCLAWDRLCPTGGQVRRRHGRGDAPPAHSRHQIGSGVGMSGFVESLWSVHDIDRACAAMVDVAGYERQELPDAEPQEVAYWQVDGCTGVQQAMLCAPGETIGRLRVVEFQGCEKYSIRPSQRSWDTGGIFDLDLFSRDARGIYRALVERHGWTAFGEPVDYVMGAFDVTQVVARGPDGLVLAIIEPRQATDIALPPPERLSRIFNSTQLVRDVGCAIAFYTDVLGWKVMMDMVIDDAVEPGADVLGLPMPHARTVRRRVAIVHPEGRNDGSVELIEIGFDGQHHGERAVAPHVGLLSLRVPVADARAMADAILARGHGLHKPPTLLDVAGIGPALFFAMRTPDGAILEFFEAVAG